MTDVDRDSPQPACPTWPAEPWPLRRVPERWKPCLLRIAASLGTFCYTAIVISALSGLTFVPLAFAALKIDSGVSRAFMWLHRLIGPRWFLPAYSAIMLVLFCLLLYGMQVAIYIRMRYGKKDFNSSTCHDTNNVTALVPDQRNQVDA
jgi:hypothetical protein